ncbi:hypothetical protein CKM354_001037100 [Cercospora kikuchii]|uniref:Uncharacterized protein n=1 Tax=Cercospora kikuchii TaxID=84275 RepID=A0A9P3CWU4_9PEZI|nr:uncharacterized protein CKM354_001037100 [Cercospora kikuchii]GIZ47275.1 hypothetical protein CKM354_001037100 [Cercospora kikuchii]
MARKKLSAAPAYTRLVAVMTRSKKRAADIDAAMRVFGVPELLEQILLLAVSDQTPARDDRRSETLKLSPMPGAAKESRGGICIFSLQRVNKDFYATINGSAKLKRLLYLAPYPNKDLYASSMARRALLPFHTPFFALLDKLHENCWNGLLSWDWQYSCHSPPSADDMITRTKVDIRDFIKQEKSLYKEATSELAQGWWNPEAKWRDIKVCNAKELVSLTVRMFYLHYVDGTASYLANLTWNLHGDESLGHIFDHFCRVLQLIDEVRRAILIIQRKWETRMEETSAKFQSHREANNSALHNRLLVSGN